MFSQTRHLIPRPFESALRLRPRSENVLSFLGGVGNLNGGISLGQAEYTLVLFSWFVGVGSFEGQDFDFISEQLFEPGGLEFEEANVQKLKYPGVTPRGRGRLRVRIDRRIRLCIFILLVLIFHLLILHYPLPYNV